MMGKVQGSAAPSLPQAGAAWQALKRYKTAVNGSNVRKGQVLARIDTSWLQAQAAHAQAGLRPIEALRFE